MKTYNEFWEELKKYYPISKGEIRLPITTSIQNLEEINSDKLLEELESILNDLLSIENNKLKDFANNNNENFLEGLFEENFNGVVRFDCVIDKDNNPKIIELNTDYPDGLLLHDKTYSILSDKKITANKDNFLKLFEKDESIFVMYPENSFFLDAYETEYLTLKQSGFNVYKGNIKDLEFKGDNVLYNGIKIDIIRRCIEVGKINKNEFNNFYNKNIKFINNFNLRALGYKELLKNIDNSLIPKTFNLNENTYKEVLSNKDDFIIKPSNLFEGKGVLIGKDTDGENWGKEIKSSLDKNFIAQEFIDIKKTKISFYDDSKIITKKLYFDFCPHFFIKDSKIIGRGLILARFSENKILNVMQGGGIGYIKTI